MSFRRTTTLLMAMLPLLAVGPVGCRHKPVVTAPQASTAPPLPPSSMTHVPSVPPMPAPAQPQVGAPGSDQKAEDTPPPPVRHPRRPKKHVAPTDSTTSSPATQVAAAIPPPSLGQLSAGEGDDSRERAAMNDQIRAQEIRLSKLKDPQGDDDKAIVTQVRVFLTKARQAIAENDLDGAKTLTTKAKVLLDELTRS